MTTVRIPFADESPYTYYYEGPRPRPDITNDFSLWQEQVCLALQGLKHVGAPTPSTADFPKTSFQQAMRELYGKSYFSAFISSRAWQQAGLEEQAEQQLQQLEQLLNAFEEPESDDLLATNLAWQDILTQTEAVAALLQPSAPASTDAKQTDNNP
jgi:hypothetical protein